MKNYIFGILTSKNGDSKFLELPKIISVAITMGAPWSIFNRDIRQ